MPAHDTIHAKPAAAARGAALPAVPEGVRAALERMSRRRDRLALRARGVLLLADGASQASVARTLRVAVSTVRAWLRRWREGGLEALVAGPGRPRADAPDDLPAALPAGLPHEEAALLLAGRTGRGRPPLARAAVEAWIRDGAALGLLPPGSRLPGRDWMRRRLHANSHVLATAAATLARQGFVRNKQRGGSFMAQSFPFENRYLMLLSASDQGLDRALAAAAREQEVRREVRWTVVPGLSGQETELGPIPCQIAAQRWAGVFLRTSPSERLGGWEFLSLDRVPISGFLGAGPWLGAHVEPLRWSPAADYRIGETPAFAAIRRAGRRRTLVIDAVGRAPRRTDRAGAVRRAAAAYGLAIPESCYQLLDPAMPEQVALVISAVLRLALQEKIDSVAVLQDNFVEPVCRGLAETFGAARAASAFVAALGHRPVMQKACLPVEWHGQDLGKTLDSFADWCDAIHAGSKSPPPPELAAF